MNQKGGVGCFTVHAALHITALKLTGPLIGGRFFLAMSKQWAHDHGMIDRAKNQHPLIDLFFMAMGICMHGVYIAGIALILGLGIPISIIIGLAGGAYIHRLIARSR